jgi:transcriptional regulator with XRE-family HTH domain
VKRITGDKLTALRAVPVTAEIPNRLRVACALAEVSQTDVAEGTGLSVPTISDIYNGKYNDLKHSTVELIAGFFGVLIEDIFPVRAATSRQAVAQ